MEQAETQELVHGQEQDSAGSPGTWYTCDCAQNLHAGSSTPHTQPPSASCSQVSPAPSQPSSHGNYTLPKPIHHGLAIFYQHLSPDNLTPAVTA